MNMERGSFYIKMINRLNIETMNINVIADIDYKKLK